MDTAAAPADRSDALTQSVCLCRGRRVHSLSFEVEEFFLSRHGPHGFGVVHWCAGEVPPC